MNGLKIEGEMFDRVREDLNNVLEGTIRALIEKGGSNATARVGLDIALDRQMVFDSGSTRGREMICPRLTYSVKAAMQQKAEVKGKIEEGYQLEFDDSGRIGLSRLGQEQEKLY